MRSTLSLLLGTFAALSLAHATEPIGGWQRLPNALYLIHGGSLADRQVPTVKDRKLSILIEGAAAKEVFDTIGPDLPYTCTAEKGDRARNKKGISCAYTAEDKGTKDGPYRCWIGLNLRTGDSIGTVSC